MTADRLARLWVEVDPGRTVDSQLEQDRDGPRAARPRLA